MDTNKNQPATAIPLPKERQAIALLGEKNEIKGYINLPKKSYFPKEVTWMASFQNGLIWLSKQNLTGMDLKILLMIMGKLDFQNYLRISQKELAAEMGIDKGNISRAIKKFCNMNILFTGPMAGRHNTYRLNPNIGHKGKGYSETVADFEKYSTIKKLKDIIESDEEMIASGDLTEEEVQKYLKEIKNYREKLRQEEEK